MHARSEDFCHFGIEGLSFTVLRCCVCVLILTHRVDCISSQFLLVFENMPPLTTTVYKNAGGQM